MTVNRKLTAGIGSLALLLSACTGVGSRNTDAGGGSSIEATVQGVLDGNTVLVHNGSGTYRLRLGNFQAPPTDGPAEVRCLGAEAQTFLAALLPAATQVRLRSAVGARELFDNAPVEVRTADGRVINAEMAAAGLGMATQDAGDLSLFAQVGASQEHARTNERGLFSTEIGCTVPGRVAALVAAARSSVLAGGGPKLSTVANWRAPAGVDQATLRMTAEGASHNASAAREVLRAARELSAAFTDQPELLIWQVLTPHQLAAMGRTVGAVIRSQNEAYTAFRRLAAAATAAAADRSARNVAAVAAAVELLAAEQSALDASLPASPTTETVIGQSILWGQTGPFAGAAGSQPMAVNASRGTGFSSVGSPAPGPVAQPVTEAANGTAGAAQGKAAAARADAQRALAGAAKAAADRAAAAERAEQSAAKNADAAAKHAAKNAEAGAKRAQQAAKAAEQAAKDARKVAAAAAKTAARAVEKAAKALAADRAATAAGQRAAAAAREKLGKEAEKAARKAQESVAKAAAKLAAAAGKKKKHG